MIDETTVCFSWERRRLNFFPEGEGRREGLFVGGDDADALRKEGGVGFSKGLV